MFGGSSLWGGPVGDVNGNLNKERNPPKKPIPVEFPSYIPTPVSNRLTSELSSRLRDRVCHVRSFAEINEADIANFNIRLHQDAEIADMVPDASLSSRPLPFDNELEAMLAEVAVGNEDAFREVLRMEPLAGRKKPRLAYARNFFGNLEDMARYWDNSNDNYYSVPKSRPAETKPSTPTSSTNAPNAGGGDVPGDQTSAFSAEQDTDMKEVYTGYRLGNGEDLPSGTRVAMVKNFLKIVMHKFYCRDHEPMPSPREKFVIRGVNVQSIQYNCCVARIPQDSQLARKRMLEGPLMGIHMRDDIRFKSQSGQAKPNPMIESVSSDTPADEQAKVNVSDGRKPAAKQAFKGPPFVGEKFDLLREVGAMLILARQREREGKSKESISGNDKWWITQQRWGGGPLKWGQMAYEQYEDEDPSWSPAERALQEERRTEEANIKNGIHDSVEASKLASMSVDDLMANNAPSIPALPGDPIAGPRKKKLRSLGKPPGKDSEMHDGRRLMYVPNFKKKWYTDWQKLRPNASTWDEKLIYNHIGKRQDSQFDDVYLLNGVNHHIGVTHMRVHPDYLKWLETGAPVGDEEVEPGLQRNVLYVWRSRWYDMFDVEARCELLVGLWKIMCWLNREYINTPESETAK